jgi:hypothetical protein
LTIWYANLPPETAFALQRSPAAVVAVVALVFALPFSLLLHPSGRSSGRVLTVVTVAQLLGLWLNCQLLVAPTFARGSPAAVARHLLVALGVLGAYAARSFWPGHRNSRTPLR